MYGNHICLASSQYLPRCRQFKAANQGEHWTVEPFREISERAASMLPSRAGDDGDHS